jgi:3-oxoacyl-[acyl-carrier-protein] synthase II
MGCAKDCHDFAFSDGSLPRIELNRLLDKSYPNFRRMDEYANVGIAAAFFALKDAGLDRRTPKREMGILVSTAYGCIGVDLDYYETVMREQATASPALFAYTLPNSFLGEAAILFGLTGKSFVINEPLPFGLTALKLALDSIALEECEQILCGVNNPNYPPPFDTHSRTVPGALFFVIEKSPAGETPPYGVLSMERSGAIRFEGKELQDLHELVRLCLPGRKSFALQRLREH